MVHQPTRPGLDHLCQAVVVRRVGAVDLGPALAGERDPLEEPQPPVLAVQVAPAADALGGDDRVDLGHVGLDGVRAERAAHRDAVVAVAHEVEVAELVDVDRRERLPGAALQGHPLPPLAAPVRRGPEPAVEVAHLVDRADDRVHRDHLQAQGALAAPAQCLDHLGEGEGLVALVGVVPHPARELGEDLVPSHAQEVVLGVRTRRSRVSHHDDIVPLGRCTGVADRPARGAISITFHGITLRIVVGPT